MEFYYPSAAASVAAVSTVNHSPDHSTAPAADVSIWPDDHGGDCTDSVLPLVAPFPQLDELIISDHDRGDLPWDMRDPIRYILTGAPALQRFATARGIPCTHRAQHLN